MNVNATLFVQAFNFCIVYWMLRIFLFKPVITIIEHEKAQEAILHDIITQQMKSLDIQEKERQRHWFICQEYFFAHQPSSSIQKKHLLSDKKIDNRDNNELMNHFSNETITQTIADVHNALKEKIRHVH